MNDAAAREGLKPALIARLVDRCIARAWIVVAAAIMLCVAMTHYVTRHFAMTTDTYALLSPKLPWRVRQAAFNQAFPQGNSDIVVVIEGRTPELSESAAARLAASLRAQTQWFRSVQRPDGLADGFDTLARGKRSAREAAEQMLIPAFVTDLDQIRTSLQPRPVSIGTLPPELVRQWQTPEGRARVSVVPKGDSNDDAVLRRFVAAGTGIAPDVTGTASYLQAYARAVVDAFIAAGVLSFVVICGLLLIALHRLSDVAITMAPIVLTGLLTMGTCVLIGQPLNFANIIALPLLFGIGVAFHIYFVMAWRSGGSHLLTSSLARGVFFSALATATGFGSLWASSHPGTASMGKLLMISLIWTLTSALLFQPALMGPARTKNHAAAATS